MTQIMELKKIYFTVVLLKNFRQKQIMSNCIFFVSWTFYKPTLTMFVSSHDITVNI